MSFSQSRISATLLRDKQHHVFSAKLSKLLHEQLTWLIFYVASQQKPFGNKNI